jgi:hypothetical protein
MLLEHQPGSSQDFESPDHVSVRHDHFFIFRYIPTLDEKISLNQEIRLCNDEQEENQDWKVTSSQ